MPLWHFLVCIVTEFSKKNLDIYLSCLLCLKVHLNDNERMPSNGKFLFWLKVHYMSMNEQQIIN